MRIFISTVQRFFHTPAVSLISAFGLTLALQGAPASAADLPTLKIGTATGPQIEALKIAAREAKVAAIPFFARVAEVNLREVDRGLIEAAQAKIVAHRAALDVSKKLFDACGARATHAPLALDRFWRNARVHTLHDPLDYRVRDVGRYALTGALPEVSLYT